MAQGAEKDNTPPTKAEIYKVLLSVCEKFDSIDIESVKLPLKKQFKALTKAIKPGTMLAVKIVANASQYASLKKVVVEEVTNLSVFLIKGEPTITAIIL